MVLLGYLAIVCIGIVLGSMGAGGSILAIPVLVYVFTIDVETASAYSLFLVGTTSLIGAALKRSEQLVSVRAAFLLGVPSMAGAFICRKWILCIIPHAHDVVLTVFSVFLIVSLSRMIFNERSQPEKARSAPDALRLIMSGFAVGAVSALAGVGGGVLILPALTILAGLPFRIAAGTSLLVIASICLIGFCGDVLNRSIDWNFLLSLTTLAVAGLLTGYWWQKRTRAMV